MSDRSSSVLYDIPGPRARRRALVVSLVVGALLLVLIALVVKRLDDQGQFSMERWGPLIDPSDDNFRQVWKLLGKGLGYTLLAAVLAIALATVLGTALGVARMMTSGLIRLPLVSVIEILRGLPVIVTIYIAWRVLPDVGIDVNSLPGPDGLWPLVVALTAYNGVIIAEIIRAGVASLPRGQREAGLANGLTNLQTMRIILLPQSFRTMLPALISQLVVILKDTSLAALLGLYTELLRTGRGVSEVLHNPLQSLFVVGAIFIAVNFTLSRLAVFAEARLSRARTRPETPLAPALPLETVA
jgi:glutamate transport system permease protein